MKEAPLPSTVPPTLALYQTMEVPDGTVPLSTALSVAVCPEQMVTGFAEIVKFVTAALLLPSPPRVAPLGGNSVSALELVVPLLPPLAFLVMAPLEIAMCPPPPPPPGPSASL